MSLTREEPDVMQAISAKKQVQFYRGNPRWGREEEEGERSRISLFFSPGHLR
jgi:hypothetical protein